MNSIQLFVSDIYMRNSLEYETVNKTKLEVDLKWSTH